MNELSLMWLKGAAMSIVKHPALKYISTFGLITGVLFTLLPLVDFVTGLQVGIIMGSYNYLAINGLK